PDKHPIWIVEYFRNSTDPRGDDASSQGHRFKEGDREAFLPRYLAVQVRARQSHPRVVHEPSDGHGSAQIGASLFDTRSQRTVTDDEEPRSRIPASNVAKGLDQVNYARHFSGVFQGTSKGEDRERALQILGSLPLFYPSRIDGRKPSCGSQNSEVAAKPQSEPNLSKLGRTDKRQDLCLSEQFGKEPTEVRKRSCVE